MFVYNLFNIAIHKDIQERLRKEINEAVGKDEGRLPKLTIFEATISAIDVVHLQKMPLLRACVKETFRFFPIGTEISRIPTKDVVLSGYLVPAGTPIDINTNVLMTYGPIKILRRSPNSDRLSSSPTLWNSNQRDGFVRTKRKSKHTPSQYYHLDLDPACVQVILKLGTKSYLKKIRKTLCRTRSSCDTSQIGAILRYRPQAWTDQTNLRNTASASWRLQISHETDLMIHLKTLFLQIRINWDNIQLKVWWCILRFKEMRLHCIKSGFQNYSNVSSEEASYCLPSSLVVSFMAQVWFASLLGLVQTSRLFTAQNGNCRVLNFREDRLKATATTLHQLGRNYGPYSVWQEQCRPMSQLHFRHDADESWRSEQEQGSSCRCWRCRLPRSKKDQIQCAFRIVRYSL